MPNRILKESICTSDTLDRLNELEENLFYRLMVQCDDYGRMDARPAILRARCYPLRLDTVSEGDVRDRLAALERAGLIWVYEVGGREYLQMTTWEKHQQRRAKYSKYPQAPPQVPPCRQDLADDSIRQQMQADVSEESRSRGVEESRSRGIENLGAGVAAPPPPHERKRSAHDQARLALEVHFAQATGLPRPEANTDKQKRAAASLWYGPLRDIAELAAWDVGEATRLIDAALAQLDGNCTVASPKSIAATALAIHTGNAPGAHARDSPADGSGIGRLQRWAKKEGVFDGEQK